MIIISNVLIILIYLLTSYNILTSYSITYTILVLFNTSYLALYLTVSSYSSHFPQNPSSLC